MPEIQHRIIADPLLGKKVVELGGNVTLFVIATGRVKIDHDILAMELVEGEMVGAAVAFEPVVAMTAINVIGALATKNLLPPMPR